MSSADVVENRLEAAMLPLRGLADDIETGGIPEDRLGSIITIARAVDRQLTGVIASLAEQANRAHEAGRGAPTEEVLASSGSVSGGQARAETARLAVFRAFPLIRAGVRAGAVFPSNVDVIARLITDMTPKEIETLAADDEVLAEQASRLASDSFGRSVRRKRDSIRRDNGANAAERATRNASARVGPNTDHTGYRVFADLDTEDGAAFMDGFQKSLRRIEKELGADHGLSVTELAVRALVDPYLRGVNTVGTFENSGPAVVVNVLTDRQTLANGPHSASVAETFDGQPIAPNQLGRLCCDATLRRIDTLPDGSVNVSHSGRTATPAQRAALRATYSGCAITGAPWSQTEIHHVVYFSKCKTTQLANLVPISRRWHHLIHDAGWKLELDPDRTIRLYRPNGQLHRTIQPPNIHALAA